MKPLTLFSLLVLVPSVVAAEDISTRLVFLSVGESISDFAFTSNGKRVAINAIPTGLSEPVDYTGPANLQIHGPASDPVEATCSVPEGADTVLVVLSRNEVEDDADEASEEESGADANDPSEDKPAIEVSAHDFSAKRVPAGAFLLVNRFDESLVAVVDGADHALEIGGDDVAVLKAPKDPITVRVRKHSEEGAPPGRTLFSTNWPNKPEQRSVVMISVGASRSFPILVSRFLEAAR